MPRLHIFNRDDELRPHLRSRATQGQAPRLRLGKRAGQPAGRAKAVGLHLPRSTPTSGTSTGGSGSHAGGGGGVGIVKAKYVSGARAHGLSKYLEKDVPEKLSAYVGREGAGHEGHKAQLFNEHGHVSEEDRERFVERSRGDPRLWHLIVSPPAADKLDMERFVSSFVQQVESDTGLKLDYIASIHRDTEHIHSHILLRGRAIDGSDFRIDRDYLSHGMRQRVEQISQRQRDLGLNREAMRETVVEVSHSRTVPQQGAKQRVQEALEKWKQGHARALAGRQAARDEGIGY